MRDRICLGGGAGEYSQGLLVHAVSYSSEEGTSQAFGAVITGHVAVFVPLSKANQAAAELANPRPPPPVVVDETSVDYRVDYGARSGISVKRDTPDSRAIHVIAGDAGGCSCNQEPLREFRDLLLTVQERLT